MKKGKSKNLLVGIDIGTSKIAVLIGEISNQDKINILGIGTHPSYGLKRGVVINIDTTVNSINHALNEAKLMAGCEVFSCYTGIAGAHVESLNSHGIVAIQDEEVTQLDVDRVIDAARAIAMPSDQKILHILPQEFIIDGQDSIREPIGMSGVRLEAKVHIISGAVSAVANIIKCVKRCGLEVNDIILEPLASSYAVLLEEEKELGSCLVDIGGGTTDIAIFANNAIRYTEVIPIAGDQVSNDIAIALRTPRKNAEKIKIKHASALQELTREDEYFSLISVGKRAARKLSSSVLASICEPRYEELFRLVKGKIEKSGFKNTLTAGVVLTGGGSQIPGAVDLAERVFAMPVRVGMPEKISGFDDIVTDPKFSTGVGLLLYGHYKVRENKDRIPFKEKSVNIWQKMKSWFAKNL